MCIARLCTSVSFMFNPPLFLGRNNVFLAIGSGVFFGHKYYKMFMCIFFVTFSGIGKILLKKVVLARVNVFIKIDFLYNDSCFIDIFCIWFSIFVKVFCQFSRIVSFKSSEKNMPKISLYWYFSNIVMFFYIGSLVCVYW